MKRVFVWNDRAGSPAGPFEYAILMTLIEEGVIRPESLVAADGEDSWTLASEHPITASCLELPVPVRSGSGAFGAESAPPAPRRRFGFPGQKKAPPPAARAMPRQTVHPHYDPDYDLDILELNSGNRRNLRDYALLTLGLNTLVVAGVLALPFNPISVAFLLSLFVFGNVSLSWLFGVVMR